MSYSKRLFILMFLDVVLIWISVATSYLIAYGGRLPVDAMNAFLVYGFFSAAFGTFCMSHFKLYQRIWQYASIGEMVSILKAVSLSCLLAYLAAFAAEGEPVPTSIALRNAETILLFLGGIRFAWRFYRDNYKSKFNLHKALIIGAGSCGVLAAKELQHNDNAQVYPIAMIDDDKRKHKLRLNGIEVVGGRHDIPAAVEKYGVEEIIIAIPSLSRYETSKIIDICKQTKAKLKIIPPIQDILRGKVTLNSIRDVQVEDLLGREPIVTDLAGIAKYLSGKVVMVTGAGGSIGSELCRQIACYEPATLLLLGRGENSIYLIERELRSRYPDLPIVPLIADVRDRSRIQYLFGKYRPHVVFHAAAHKHVPLMESNPAEAVKNNIFGTKHVADAADNHGTELFVLISTDKAVNPSSVMGTTKRIAEMYIQSLKSRSATKYAAVRFGNVLGSRGSVIPLFKEQIARGGPVTVTHPEMVRYFMTIPEAVQLVIQAGAFTTGGEIFVLDMGEPVRILNLAEDLIRLSGYEPYTEIEIRFTGMREGEKLFEELLFTEEEVSTTQHNRIYIGNLQQVNPLTLDLAFKRLEAQLVGEDEAIGNVLEEIVPSLHRKVRAGAG